MSDGLCGDSTPFKGLVAHQTKDSSLQRGLRDSAPSQPTASFRNNAAGLNGGDDLFGTFMGDASSLQLQSNELQAPQIQTHPQYNMMVPAQHFQATPAIQQPHTAAPSVNHQAPIPTGIHPSSLAMPNPTQGQLIGQEPRHFASPIMAAHMYNRSMPPMQQATPHMAPLNSLDVQMEMDKWLAANAAVVQGSDQGIGASSVEQDFSEVNDIMDQLAENLSRDMNIKSAAETETLPPKNSLRKETDVALPTMDSAPDTEKQASNVEKPKPSDISEVARQILDSVDHEDDEKWKNSSFFALMRDFRDGNKEVLDDKILDTKAPALP
ncbi:uncharacterized protein BROUX77_002570 [Berkeleyomyces rouxiae]|uniref:uncharacterized protein n=1 Tax=Berkeleyomyces rouxiae TaxID=2035830 RepID=UPI003B80363A